MSASINTIFNKRLLAILAISFSSGLPLALTGTTLQAWFTEAQISVVTIGTLTLLGLPYTLKFLWAPLMDYFSFPQLGKRRGWIVLTQLFLIFELLILAEMDPTRQAASMGMMALCIAFFSASQDIAVDAYRTDILPEKERGIGASYFVFAYRIAMLFSGGIALIIADLWGFKFTYQLMAFLILMAMLPTLFAPTPQEIKSTGSLWRNLKETVVDIGQRERILLLLLFIGLYKIGDAFALTLMSNFLLKGLGFTLTQVGLAYKTTSIFATIIGCFVGGLLLTRWSIYHALMVFGIAQMLSNVMFILLAILGKQYLFMVFSIFIENFCSGLSTAAFLSFLMSICNQRYTAGQYALFSAIASLGRVFLGPFAGILVAHFGWVQFFMVATLACIPGLLILIRLKSEVASYAHALAD